MYLHENTFVLVGEKSNNGLYEQLGYNGSADTTVFYIYDVSKPEKPKMIRKVDIAGKPSSIKLIGDQLYFALELRSLSFDFGYKNSLEYALPAYWDSLLGDNIYLIPPKDIYHSIFVNNGSSDEGTGSAAYTIFGSIDLNNKKTIRPKAYEGFIPKTAFLSDKTLIIYTTMNGDGLMHGETINEMQAKKPDRKIYYLLEINTFSLEHGELIYNGTRLCIW